MSSSWFLYNFSVNCATVEIGEIGFCACKPCSENHGDCDFDSQCQQGQRCKSNSCPNTMGFDSNADCCQIANLGDVDFCTNDEPCGVDQGHCEENDECRNDLVCGYDNCPNSLGVTSEMQCCEPKCNPFI